MNNPELKQAIAQFMTEAGRLNAMTLVKGKWYRLSRDEGLIEARRVDRDRHPAIAIPPKLEAMIMWDVDGPALWKAFTPLQIMDTESRKAWAKALGNDALWVASMLMPALMKGSTWDGSSETAKTEILAILLEEWCDRARSQAVQSAK